jgi:hypothetical protein
LWVFTDWCKSEQGAEISPGSGSGEHAMSGSTSSKVMVVDPGASGRKSLTLMLERCGMEVFNLLPSLLNLFLIVSPGHDENFWSQALFCIMQIAAKCASSWRVLGANLLDLLV